MDSLFPPLDTFVLALLPEKTDRNGKHMEYRDRQGAVFARMAKVYKKGGFLNLFPADGHVHAELKDAAGALRLTTTSYRRHSPRPCEVEIAFPDGTALGVLHDAPYGTDFAGPDGGIVGRARRPEDGRVVEPREVVHTFTDAAGRVVGTCERRYPEQNDSLLDFLSGLDTWGMPVQVVSLTAPAGPPLRDFLFLFPALQHLRFVRHG